MGGFHAGYPDGAALVAKSEGLTASIRQRGRGIHAEAFQPMPKSRPGESPGIWNPGRN